MNTLLEAIDKILKAIPNALLKKCNTCPYNSKNGCRYRAGTSTYDDCTHEQVINSIAYMPIVLAIMAGMLYCIGAGLTTNS